MWPVKVTCHHFAPPALVLENSCLDDRSLVRMKDEEGACCERCDTGHQLALRFIRAISATQFEFFTLSSPPLGELVGVVPLGRIHMAASSKSPSRRLLSFPLGSLPRVAAAEMGEVAGIAERCCEQLTFYMWLTVLHCDVESTAYLPQHMVWLRHLSAAVGLLCLETKQKLTGIPSFYNLLFVLKIVPISCRNHASQTQETDHLALMKWRWIILLDGNRSRGLQTLCAVLWLVAQSHPILCDSMDWSPLGTPQGPSVHSDSPGKNTEVGCHALLQGVFPT